MTSGRTIEPSFKVTLVLQSNVCLKITGPKEHKEDCLPTVKNSTPEPEVHCQDGVDVPQASIFIISPFIRPQRQLIIQKDKKGEPTMKLHRKA